MLNFYNSKTQKLTKSAKTYQTTLQLQNLYLQYFNLKITLKIITIIQ